ncbi:hypothetical protein NBRC110019_20630 [Neptunitalea chrysea]|uniref:Uncharacterized protein n=1 Tax=Neptunitalea chrysea TaxID=1647581 RepID=A0A9W6B8Q5_9FLAO|nr:hypothetical protein NBRC110019_20630 [Neptunitalea chrysea]
MEDCIFWPAKPNIKTNNIPSGYFNTYYYAEIEAEIENDPDDLQYHYDFDWDGTIPAGLSYWVHNNKFFLEGYPSQTGRFSFTVYVYVEPPYEGNYDEWDDDNICLNNDTASKSFQIEIY